MAVVTKDAINPL